MRFVRRAWSRCVRRKAPHRSTEEIAATYTAIQRALPHIVRSLGVESIMVDDSLAPRVQFDGSVHSRFDPDVHSMFAESQQLWITVVLPQKSSERGQAPKKLTLPIALNSDGTLSVTWGGVTRTAHVPSIKNKDTLKEEVLRERASMPALAETIGYFVGLRAWESRLPSDVDTLLELLPTKRPLARRFKALSREKVQGGERDTQPAEGTALADTLDPAETYAEIYAKVAGVNAALDVLLKRVVRTKQRKEYIKEIHGTLDLYGQRAEKAGFRADAVSDQVLARRRTLFKLLPRLGPVVQLHGTRWGRRAWGEPGVGPLSGRILRSYISTLPYLLSVFASDNAAQQGRDLVRVLGVRAWPDAKATSDTDRAWERNLREPIEPSLFLKPPLIDNAISTLGTVGDITVRLAMGLVLGQIDPALMAVMAGSALTTSLALVVSDLQTYSPNVIAYLLHNKAMEIARRGEPVEQLAELEKESRHLHLAVLDFLASPQGQSLSPEQRTYLSQKLRAHDQLLSLVNADKEKSGLKPVELQTSATGKRDPLVKHRFLKWMAPTIVASAVAGLGAAVFGGPAYWLYVLPSMATTAVRYMSLGWFSRSRTKEKENLELQARTKQVDADVKLRERVQSALDGSVTSESDPIGAWVPTHSRFSSFATHMKQAVVVGFVGLGTAFAVTHASDVLANWATGFMITSFLTPFFQAIAAKYWDSMSRKSRAEHSGDHERADIRELANKLDDLAGVGEHLSGINRRLRSVGAEFRMFIPKTDAGTGKTQFPHSTHPQWIDADPRIAEICSAVAKQGSANASRFFVEELQQAGGHGKNFDKQSVFDYLEQLCPGWEQLPLDRYAQTVAAAARYRYELRIGETATVEFHYDCAGRALPPERHLPRRFGPLKDLHQDPFGFAGRADKYNEYIKSAYGNPDMWLPSGQIKTKPADAVYAIQTNLTKPTAPKR